jgi:hypothetical protein
MTGTDILIAILIGAAIALFHALALGIATQLMVHTPVVFGRAMTIVLLEYAAALLVGMILLLTFDNQRFAIAGAVITYLFTGAILIDRWLCTQDGERLGMGNGVLNQALQIPLLIPLLIIAWWLYDILT